MVGIIGEIICDFKQFVTVKCVFDTVGYQYAANKGNYVPRSYVGLSRWHSRNIHSRKSFAV